MIVAVIGANGQLGADVVRAFREAGDAVCALTHADIDIVNLDALSAKLEALSPQLIVNTAAMHHVEKCEQAPGAAFSTNALGARHLALVARTINATLAHISTDYVFDGMKHAPYEEGDLPKPLNIYGNTKLAGEYFVQTIAPKHWILRTSALYGKAPCRAKGGLNFVELMLKLGREKGRVRVVDDEFVSPTFTAELAEQVVTLSRSDANGLFHATAEGSCSWFEFAHEIFSISGIQVALEAATPGEFPAKVPRPKYSVLENRALKDQGLNRFSPWRDGLKRYLCGGTAQRVAVASVPRAGEGRGA
jgi:dTDP-4-dehydrorhamnose reductase